MNFLGRLHQCRTDKAESNKTWMTLENRYLQVKNLLTCLCARIASQILSMKNCKDDTSPIKTHSCLRVRNWKFLTKCCHYSIMWCWFWWQRKGAIHFGRLGGICWCHQPISQAPNMLPAPQEIQAPREKNLNQVFTRSPRFFPNVLGLEKQQFSVLFVRFGENNHDFHHLRVISVRLHRKSVKCVWLAKVWWSLPHDFPGECVFLIPSPNFYTA